MFEGVQDQFIAAAAAQPPQQPILRASPTSLPLSFSLLHASNPFPIFDPNYPPPNTLILPPPNHHHHIHLQPPLHHHFPPSTHIREGGAKQDEQAMEPGPTDPWSNEEVLALLRIRSAMENWFPDFSWEHVSRKLAEIGSERSPEKCKEKFEEQSRYLQTSTKDYRLFSELEELCNHGDDPPPPPSSPPLPLQGHQQDSIPPDGCKDQNVVVLDSQEQEREDGGDHDDQEKRQEKTRSESSDQHQVIEETDEDQTEKETKKRRSHRRLKKFGIFKSFCEEIVNKMMAKQEDLHNKILQDMIKRDEEEIAREQAWRKQEIERINTEIKARARDRSIVNERQTKLIELLKKFTADPDTNPSSSSNDESFSQTSNSAPKKRRYAELCNDAGKRWPREEVLALINIRCSVDPDNDAASDDHRQNQNSTSNGENNCGGNSKNPSLWERISQRMGDLGYERSARRCKEKWENINKYFRKTKDMNKKRSVSSRTCPYFQQLSHLYSQGRIAGSGSGRSSTVDGDCDGGVPIVNDGEHGEDYVVQVRT